MRDSRLKTETKSGGGIGHISEGTERGVREGGKSKRKMNKEARSLHGGEVFNKVKK